VILQKHDNWRGGIWQHGTIKFMKTKLFVLIFLLAAAAARAQTNNLTALLQQGLLEEQANGNLDAAIADYRSLAAEFDKDRQLTATAVFRLGECYRAQGKTNEAVAQYQRILREFPDQETLATMSRQNLTGLGVITTEAKPSENADAKLWDAVKNLPPSQLEKVLPTLAPGSGLADIVLQRDLAADKFLEVRRNYGNEHPTFRAAQAVLEATNKRLAETIDGIMQALKLRAEMSNTGVIAATGASSNDVTPDEDREIQRIRQMIQNSPDLINSGELGRAANSGELRVATFLLDHGADVNWKLNGGPPLDQAAMNAQKTMVELLLSRGADVNALTRSGGTALLTATRGGFQAVVEVLLAHKADVNAHFTTINQTLTPLHLAAEKGYANLIKLLLAAGANPNVENSEGQTPLSYAAENGYLEIVKMLLAAKADPDGGKLDVPLLSAIHKQDALSAEQLLEAGANPNAASAEGWTQRGNHITVAPLWLAIDSDQLPMVNLLLKFKADPNDPQAYGRPLLFQALSNPDILEAMLDAGAKADVRDAQGNTALHWAASPGKPLADRKVFELLLNHQADPNVRNNDDATPLNLVNRSGDKNAVEIADLLRQHGALDNLPNWDRIEVTPASAHSPATVFRKGTNDWNRFTLLETILNYYVTGHEYRYPGMPHGAMLPNGGRQPDGTPFQGAVWTPKQPANSMPFPDLTRVVIVRPSHASTNATRITVNLLNSTNGVDCSKDVPLEFGDMVEIPERDHSLGDAPVRLTGSQVDSIVNYLKGNVQLVVRDQKAEVPLDPVGNASTIGAVLGQTAAQQLILASSDLSRVKVTRHDPKTGEKHEWILDCSNSQSPDLWLHDGDVIEVPEKP
jgi:ankyrin repeat protein